MRKKRSAGSGGARAVGTVMALTLLGLTGCSSDDGGGGGTPDNTPDSSDSAEAAQAPKGPARVGPAPTSVPSVREWKAVRGTGWKPTRTTRVVTQENSLTDEAKLLAGELKVKAATAEGRPGDIELKRGGDEPREGYTLVNKGGKVQITGSSAAGVFYGTRTLLQTYRAQGRFAEGTVRDRPDRPQRGFMLDIARKPFDAEWIEARLRRMGDLKLNQLQLHLSDDQAVRVESETHPEVVSEPHLTKAQVKRIVDLAASRHIEVIPEVDSPGHLGAVLKAHPDLQLRSASGEVARGAIDIGKPKAAKIVDDLIGEYADLFPGKYGHVGGDEYQALMTKDPEASYPGLAKLARKRYGADGDIQDLATDWINKRAATMREHGKTPQVWNDGMHRGGEVKPSRDRQVTYWTGKEIGARPPEEYLKEGWKLVNLNDEYLYYVLGQPNDFTYPTGQRIYESWTPAVLRGTKAVPARWAGRDRIPGGRFAVWCDLAGSQTTAQVASGIRLPLAATAQKLWDPAKPKASWSTFVKRVSRTEAD